MNIETVALAVSLATFAGSVVSPIVVTIINNRHEVKKRRYEHYEDHKHEVIENYLRSVGEFFQSEKSDGLPGYGASCAEIYMYTSESLWPQIDEIDRLILEINQTEDYQQRQTIKNFTHQKFLELRKAFSAYARNAK